jgi:hypothetical protein
MIMSVGGRAVVCAVGENTAISQLGESNKLDLEDEAHHTPLKQKLQDSCD